MNNKATELNFKGDSSPSFPSFLNEGEDAFFEQAQSSWSREQISNHFYYLAKMYYDKGDMPQAEKSFIQAYRYLKGPEDTFKIFKILGFLIRIASEKLDHGKAQSYIEEAERLLETLPSTMPSLNIEYFYNAGAINTYKGDFEQARTNYGFAYKKSQEEGDNELLSKTLLALAVNSFNRKDYKESLDYLNKLSELLKIIEKNYLCGAMFFYKAKAYAELGMHQESLACYRQANEVLQEKKCWNLLGYVLLGKGSVYRRSGHYEKSLDFFRLAEEFTDKAAFRRLSELLRNEIKDVSDNSIDLYLDRANRKVKEKDLGVIDFRHRFVLLEILFLLANNPGTYYDKEQLAKQIWKEEYNPLIHDKLIYTSVSRLRKLIEPRNERGEKRKYIVRGKDGYVFDPTVKIRFRAENQRQENHAIANVDVGIPV